MVKGHLSTKVPNVRLRAQPVPAKASASTKANAGKKDRAGDDRVDDEPDDPNEETSESLNNVFRPFAGVVVSFTGVKDKAAQWAMATELGARPESSLTDTTTHLVATDFTSEKYKVSLSLGLPILSPNWIPQTHSVWRDGGDVSLKESISAHRLPAFQGLRICISGFPTGTQRDTMIALIGSLQGEYSGSIDPSCTHLISAYDSSDKIDFVKRLNADLLLGSVMGKPAPKRTATRMVDDGLGLGGKTKVEYQREQVEIKIVRPQWFWDCVGAHGRWKEDEYDIGKPESSILKKNVPQFIPPGDLALRGRDSSLAGLSTSIMAESSAAVAAASSSAAGSAAPALVQDGNERHEQAVVKRRRTGAGVGTGGGVEGLVQDILGNVAGSSSGGVVKRRRVIEDEEEDDDLPSVADVGKTARRRSSTDKAPAPSSKNVPATGAPPQLSRMLSMARSTSFASASNAGPSGLTLGRSLAPGDPPSRSSSSSSAATPMSLPFKGLRFLLRCGMKQVRRDMETCVPILGGVIVKEEDKEVGEGVDYVIVRLNRGKPRTPLPFSTSSSRPRPRYVTQHWVESCFRDDKFCSIEGFRHHTPVNVSIPIPGADGIVISATKVPFRMQTCLSNLIDCFGGTYEETFSRRVTHLVCSPDEVAGQKYGLALKWGTPIVSPEWLSKMAEEGKIPELKDFVLGDSIATDKLDRMLAARLPPPVMERSHSDASTDRTLSRNPSAADLAQAVPAPLGSTPTLLDDPPASPSAVPPRTPPRPISTVRVTSPTRLSQPASSPRRLLAKDTSSATFDNPLSPPQRISTSRLLNEASIPLAEPFPVTIITTGASSPILSPAKLAPLALSELSPAASSKGPFTRVVSGASSSSSSGVLDSPDGLSSVAKGKRSATGLTDDLKEMIDRAGSHAPEGARLGTEALTDRPTKRTRILGRPARTTRSPSAAAVGLSPTHSRTHNLAPPSPPVPYIPSTYHPNSPPSSQRPSQQPAASQGGPMVEWVDPEAQRVKQRILDSLKRGEMLARGEEGWEEIGAGEEEGVGSSERREEEAVEEEKVIEEGQSTRRRSGRVKR